jgi:hypothetical protein
MTPVLAMVKSSVEAAGVGAGHREVLDAHAQLGVGEAAGRTAHGARGVDLELAGLDARRRSLGDVEGCGIGQRLGPGRAGEDRREPKGASV